MCAEEVCLTACLWVAQASHSRGGSTSYQPNNGEGIGSLVRLVEALEMYDHGVMESYMSEEDTLSMESQALKGGYHKRKVWLTSSILVEALQFYRVCSSHDQ